MNGQTGSLEAVVFGVAAMDLVVQVDHLPAADELVLAQGYEYYPGGSGANVAVGMARLGRRVGFWGPLGVGPDAQALVAAFEVEPVDCSACPQASQSQARCIITVDKQGERTIVALGGAGKVNSAQELDLAYLCRGRVLMVTEYCGEIALAALKAGRAAGTVNFYNPGGTAVAAGFSYLAELLPWVDVLQLSRTEIGHLLPGCQPEKAAWRLRQAGVQVVVITLGAAGAWIAFAEELVHIPAMRGLPVVDTTGAGDAFAAGLVCGYLEGKTWPEAARLANAVAALKLGARGARSGLPYRSAVESILAAGKNAEAGCI